jgi:hypothetical protein
VKTFLWASVFYHVDKPPYLVGEESYNMEISRNLCGLVCIELLD